MMNGHRVAFPAPEGKLSSRSIPLLDDEFDPDEEDILDHSDIFPLQATHQDEEEFLI